MFIAVTGTPGVGKTSVTDQLIENDLTVVHLFKTAVKNGFILDNDNERNSRVLDISRLNDFIKNNYAENDLVFIDGHLSYLLDCVDKVIVLRCHPDKLKHRLSFKGWSDNKVSENINAEILDVILCDIVDNYSDEDIFEIDTTDKSVEEVFSCIVEIKDNSFDHMKKYNIGNIDWSEEIFKDF